MSDYKSQHTFESRLEESTRIKEKFPGRIPVIVERCKVTSNIPDIDKKKFLVPSDLSVSQFIFIIRKRIQLPSEMALFLFVNQTLPTTSTLIRELYEEHQNPDGFLYMEYSGENTFG